MLCQQRKCENERPLRNLHQSGKDIRKKVLSLFTESKAAFLLSKLNFDVRKYSNSNFDFLLADLQMFLHGLNKNYHIYDDFSRINDLDVMCFYEPWLSIFLEKVLEKRQSTDKLSDHT